MESVDLLGLMGEGKTEDLPEALRYLPFHIGSSQALPSFAARARATRAWARTRSRDGGAAISSSGSNNTGSRGTPCEDGDDSSSDRDSDCNSSNRSISSGSKRKGRQLTFFYQGKVYVYDHVSSAQARAIVASMSDSIGLVNPSADLAAPILKANIPDRLPLARKASLARFLAKRNERVQNLRLSQALLKSKNNMEGYDNAAFDPIRAASKRQCLGNPDS